MKGEETHAPNGPCVGRHKGAEKGLDIPKEGYGGRVEGGDKKIGVTASLGIGAKMISERHGG